MLVVLTAKPNEPSQRPGFLTCHVGRRKISLSTQQHTTPDLTGFSNSSSTTTEQPPSQNTHTIRILSSLQGRASTTWVIRVSDGGLQGEGVGGVSQRKEAVPGQWAGLERTRARASSLLLFAFTFALQAAT
ncbi:hypothetical protein HJG60_008022 [Phyllostomus discolor]|uniref:Uncharacterized protein n=1 Tax=Phyllostomus discolor TaxID=89673 RepID=A0A834EYG0_9CHIR|nr:hypothetical protein HJG60_008022 [Phyllostomus discolor]